MWTSATGVVLVSAVVLLCTQHISGSAEMGGNQSQYPYGQAGSLPGRQPAKILTMVYRHDGREDAVIYYISPRIGSSEGHTLITLTGKGFSESQFGSSDNVTLVSATRSIPCDIHKDGCDKTKLTCYTRSLPQDDYYVRVHVAGNEVPEKNHCRSPTDWRCRFTPKDYRTPTITLVEPRSGPPGTVIKVTGRIMTTRVFSTQGASTNGYTARIRRSYFGLQNCELKKNDTTDELYGIALNSNGESSYGWFKCRITGSYIGNGNLSLIVEGGFGRAKRDLGTKHVTKSNQIAMFQTYAVVNSVTPSSGSTEGGSRITLKGKFFDDLYTKPKVIVGGAPCTVIPPIKQDEIVCKTPAQQVQTLYSGNRGARVYFWYDDYVYKTNMVNRIEEKRSQYTNKTMFDGAGFMEHSDVTKIMNKYAALAVFWFHPPVDGDYTFILHSDDGGAAFISTTGNTSNMEPLVSCASYCPYVKEDQRGYDKYPTQISKPYTFKAGQRSYIEVMYADYGGSGYVKLGVKLPNTNFVSTQTFDADNEKQTIKIVSTVVKEVQTVELKNWATVTKVNEVQEVSLVGNSDSKFRLGLKGTFTETVSMSSSKDDIVRALSNIPTAGAVTVSKATISGGIKLTVTFTGDLGDIPDLTHDSPDKNLKVTVVEKTKGVSSNKVARLVLNNVPSSAFKANPASASEIKAALWDMFSVKCPPKLTGTKPGSGNIIKHHIGFENNDKSSTWGKPAKDREPYCGRTSLRDPDYLFKSDNSKFFPVILGQYKHICFAYKGAFQPSLYMRFSVKSSTGTVSDKTYSWGYQFSSDTTKWHYTCIDINAVATKAQSSGSEHRLKDLRIFPSKEDSYVDEIEITKVEAIAKDALLGLETERVLPPSGVLMEEITVTPSSGAFKISLSPYNCANSFPKFALMGFQGSSQSGPHLTVSRDTAASPAVEGTYILKHNGVDKVIPANIEADALASEIQSIPGVGHVKVEREGLCHNHSWTVQWIDVGGDQPQIEVDGTNLKGNSPAVSVDTVVNGSLIFDIIPGEMISTVETKPQVVAKINNIPVSCNGTCDFEWKTSSTPVITDLQPTSGSAKTEVTIAGTNLLAVQNSPDVSTVVIGGDNCTISSHTDTQIKCNVGNGELGKHRAVVEIAGKGYAKHDTSTKEFTVQGSVTSMDPKQGSRGGGTILVIKGSGFSKSSGVTVGGEVCPVVGFTHTEINCTVPTKPQANSDTAAVKVTHPVSDLNSPTAFTYSASLTPTIDSVSETTSEVSGGATLEITGKNLQQQGGGAPNVTLCGKAVTISNHTDTSIWAVIPPNKPGICSLLVDVKGSGNAVFSSNKVPTIKYTLEVSAIYPTEGSTLGGTHLTLKGQGFPTDKTKVNVTLGDHAVCNVTETTANQIVCKTPKISKTHVVNNMGTSPKHGTGYAWNPAVITIQAGDSIWWKWAVPAMVQHKGYTVIQTVSQTNITHKTGGFTNGNAKTKQGSFKVTLSVPGEYHYTSGPVDTAGDIIMRGLIKVVAKTGVKHKVKVEAHGIEAEYKVKSGVTITPSGNCIGTVSPLTGCSTNGNTPTDRGVTGHFNFTSSVCHTPVVTRISPNEVYPGDTITIEGSGLGAQDCENEVTIGEHTCVITSSSATTVKCNIPASSKAGVYRAMAVNVRVQNRGNALLQINETSKSRIIVKPYFDSSSPVKGSVAGGTMVTISGGGFPVADTSGVMVSLDGRTCDVKSVTYTEVVCESRAKADSTGQVQVSLTASGVPPEIPCTSNSCNNYTYDQSSTCTVSSVTVTDGSQTGSYLLTFAGDFKSVNVKGGKVTVGNQDCVITTSTATSLKCDVTSLVTGDHSVGYYMPPVGLADLSGSTQKSVTIQGSITSVSPTSGSVNGGTKVTIQGKVFNDSDTTTVSIGKSKCITKTITLDTIVCVTESGSGQSAVTVVTGGVTLISTDTFDFSTSKTPTVTGISPTSGTGSASITVVGDHFSTTAGDNMVNIGKQKCTPTQATSVQIRCSLPAVGAGVYNVTASVSGVGKATVASGVKYTAVPTLSNVNPNSGSFGGGQTITVSGNGLAGDNANVSLTVCGQPCKLNSRSLTAVECITPGNSGSGTVNCDIKVIINSQTATLSQAYSYDDSKTPTITDVQPRRAGTGGGSRLTITGTKFGSNSKDVSVSIAGVTCDLDTAQFSATQVVCVTNGIKLTTKTKIRLEVSSDGIADQTKADFEYIDLWSSKFTWGGGPLPAAGELVVIKKGQTILLDTNTPVLKSLLIQGGSLVFDDTKDIQLQAEIILVTDGGLFQIGTEEKPHKNKAEVLLHGHIMSKELPIYGTKVLAIRQGTLDLHGSPTHVTWTKLASTAAAGTKTLKLQTPVNWRVGDKIVLPTTSHRHSQKETEEATITAVSSDGKTLTLKDNLKYGHISVEETIGGETIATRGEVGLLTHNIVIRGSDDKQWHDKIEACPDGFDTGEFKTQTCFQGRFGDETGSDQFGAHIMIHAPNKSANLVKVRIEYVEVTHAGQAFRLGRYPIHFHLNGDMNGCYVRGAAIHHTFNRAINIHGSHYLLIEHNVVYNVMGGAIFLEDGIEIGNTFQYNLAVFVKSSTSLLNDDITPASFWVTNPNNTYQHNAVAGGSHFGWWYRMHKHSDGPSYDSNYCPQEMVMGIFKNNSAHSFGWFGLWIFQDYYPSADGKCNSQNPAPAVFNSLYTWNCEKGSEWVDVRDLQFVDFISINDEKAGIEMKMNTNSKRKYKDTGAMIKGGVFVGHYSQSSATYCTARALILPYDSGLTVKGVKFINFDRECYALGVTSIDGKCKAPCGGYGYQMSGLVFVSSPKRVYWRFLHEAFIEDTDGSISGEVGAKILPWTDILPTDKCKKVTSYCNGMECAQCKPSVEFVRFAFNRALPKSLIFKNAVFTNSFGKTMSPWADKRLTHKQGWMVMLVAGMNYFFYFENAGHITNISYDGGFYDMKEKQSVIITTNISTTPDRIFVKPGDSRAASSAPLSYGNNIDGDYYLDSVNKKVSYIVSDKTSVSGRRRRASPTLVTRSVRFQAYKCFYPNCIAPKDPNTVPPTEGRPTPFLRWSEASTWTTLGVSKPVAGDDVTVPKDTWLVVDEAIPSLKTINIFGALELENATKSNGQYHNHVIKAKYIFVKGGRFVCGWPTWPFKGEAQIVLQGSHSTDSFKYPSGMSGPALGAKVIGAFGGLDLHGKPTKVQWTNLASTGAVGSNKVTVADNVDWAVGSEIVLTTTSYDAWQTETFKITATDGTTLTLNDTLKHKHLSETYNIPNVKSTVSSRTTYSLKAKVGLLTRNIKIVGEDYAGRDKESFGARVLVGTLTEGLNVFTGFARMSNVEFVHTGQEGFVDFYDPRFSIAYLDCGEVTEVKPSYVTSCSFHDGYSTAIGVFGTDKLLVQNNVIHRTVSDAVRIWGNKNFAMNNLVALVVWPGSYNGRKESTNFDFVAGFDVTKAKALTMNGNVVHGSERSGYKVPGESCSLANPMWKNNEVIGCMEGVLVMPKWSLQEECLRLSGFTVARGYDFGIYAQSSASQKIDNSVFIDNGLGIFPFILGPGILSHVKEDKYVHVSDSTFIGTSPDFDCVKDVYPNNDNFKFSEQARAWRSKTGGRVGVSWPNFVSASNNAPKKPWIGLMSYTAIGGIMTVKNTHFADFKQNTCNGKTVGDVVFSGNPSNDDAMHPIESSNLGFGNVPDDSLFFLPRPNVGKINPSDCVDMDCDGQKKNLFKDLDGSVLGLPDPAAVTSQSDFAWDGDRRRGVGDYRIPKAMLMDANGNRLQVSAVAPHKGIIRDGNNFVNKTQTWQGYLSRNLNYEMMIIESMDKDTEMRRLSPVALLCQGGYVDLINGPQDHGWCDGYTCQERVSTFYSIVATGKHCDLYFSSTNPQHTRFYLLNTDATEGVRLAVHYISSYRLDVYRDGKYVLPLNSGLNGKGENILLQPQTAGQYIPTFSSPSGTNYFENDKRLQYIIVKGADTVDIITSPKVVLSFSLPAMTVDQFFDGSQIVNNLATFLGIPASKIKVVKIVRADGSSGRRKRAAAAKVEIEISDDPIQQISTGTNKTDDKILQSANSMVNISNAIVSATQLQQMDTILNMTVLTLAVVEPLPPPDSTAWNDVAKQLNNNTYAAKEVPIPSKMAPVVWTGSGVESSGLKTVPVIHVVDSSSQHVSLLGSTSAPWEVTATLRGGTNANAKLVGNVTIPFRNGYANFTDLAISHTGTGYMIDFAVTKPADASFLKSTIGPYDITARTMTARAVALTRSVEKGGAVDLTIEVVDTLTNKRAIDIFWKGHTWQCTLGLYSKAKYPGKLTSTSSLTVAVNSQSLATFQGVKLSHRGRVAFSVNCVTSPSSSYSFSAHTKTLNIKRPSQQMPRIEATKKMKMRFKQNYDHIVGQEELFIARVDNFLSHKHTETVFDGYTLSRGSIVVSFWLNGTKTAVDTTVDTMWQDLQAGGYSLDFGNLTVTTTEYLSVDGQQQNPNTVETADEGLHIGAIIGIGIAVGLVIFVIILVIFKIVYKPHKHIDVLTPIPSKTKLSESPTNESIVSSTATGQTSVDGSPKPSTPREHSATSRSQVIMVQGSGTSDILGRPTSRENTVVSTGISGSKNNGSHPFGMESENVGAFEGTGMMVKPSSPGGKEENYNPEGETKKVLDDFKIVMNHLEKQDQKK